MNKPKFTPGPWRCGANNLGQLISVLHGPEGVYLSSADAHLIAAAPEMYELLSFLESHVDMSQCSVHAVVRPWGNESIRDYIPRLLAKARGETDE